MSILPFVMMGFATVLVLFWVSLYKKYVNSFDAIIETIDGNLFKMPELYFIGFGAMDRFKVNLKTEKGRKKQKKIAEVYGVKYAEYYHYCIVGGQITYGLTFIPLGLLLGAVANDITFAVLVIVAAAAIIAYLDMQINNAVEEKRDQILSDLPEVLSKLTLLINAGLVVREAWNKVAYTSGKALYKEMQITSEEMQNGISEIDAIYNFSQRCPLKEVRKLSSVITQNIQKGGAELAINLRLMNEESWEEKKHRAKRKGETASSKLMFPLLVMFAGILLMVAVPIFVNMF